MTKYYVIATLIGLAIIGYLFYQNKPKEVIYTPAPYHYKPVEERIVPICSFNKYNCSAFTTHKQAQYVYEYCGGVNNDIHHLDGDHNGVACEALR